jgi:hypothetical protein
MKPNTAVGIKEYKWKTAVDESFLLYLKILTL